MRNPSSRHAFSRSDLLAVVIVAALLSMVLGRAVAGGNSDSELPVCRDNLRQIMAAVAMYSSDNYDHLPHPSWGGGLTGPDNWCYATVLPTGEKASSTARGAGGPDGYKAQLPFFKAGQLAPFVKYNQRILVCPMDWRESMSTKAESYRLREQKLSSYSANGTISGYVGQGPILPKRTYKISDFLPADFLIWEQADGDPFYFNDAGNNPEAVGEGLSQRHAAPSGAGFACAGTAAGTAQVIRTEYFQGLQTRKTPSPNDILNGPRYRY